MVGRWVGSLWVDVKRRIDNNGYVVVSVASRRLYSPGGWVDGDGGGRLASRKIKWRVGCALSLLDRADISWTGNRDYKNLWVIFHAHASLRSQRRRKLAAPRPVMAMNGGSTFISHSAREFLYTLLDSEFSI